MSRWGGKKYNEIQEYNAMNAQEKEGERLLELVRSRYGDQEPNMRPKPSAFSKFIKSPFTIAIGVAALIGLSVYAYFKTQQQKPKVSKPVRFIKTDIKTDIKQDVEGFMFGALGNSPHFSNVISRNSNLSV